MDRLDPNAVNELFENVVYGDGLFEDDGVRQRRLDAERRRLEMERRAQENALHRAQAENDRLFFDRLLLSGPDRPALPDPVVAPPEDPQRRRPARVQIVFTAADRSRVPRKTRQHWLDKFGVAAEAAFPGVLATLDSAVVLSLEQSVYQTAKTATAYIGAWINRMHALKAAPSLGEFLSPSARNDAEAPRPAEEEMRPAEEAPTPAEEAPEMATEAAPMLSLSRPGKASLLGKELPFSLFGSDEDEMDVQEAGDVQPRDCTEQERSKAAGAATVVAPVESTGEAAEEGVASVALERVSSCSESMKPSEAEPEAILQPEECVAERDDTKQDDDVQPGDHCTEDKVADDLVDKPMIDEPKCRQLQDKPSRKRGLTTTDSSSEKKRKTFDPECRIFIRDVVAAHLRLRFGKDLSGKTIVSIQTRVVDKILSNPKWTLERLRKHKRDIDDFAERYAEKIRREKPAAEK